MTDWGTLADIGTAAGTLVADGRGWSGRQPSITRFVLLPQASSWRCDAARHWSLPPGTELPDPGIT